MITCIIRWMKRRKKDEKRRRGVLNVKTQAS